VTARSDPVQPCELLGPGVLIVDDNAEFRRVARKLLELRGYRVAGEASCAASALAAVACLAPDAILLDVRLGDDCGFALARALACRRPAPAVLLTSGTDDGDGEARARASGARGFVRKPDLVTTDLGRFWPGARVRRPRRR
jgi:CheY-like chemotaxis protein